MLFLIIKWIHVLSAIVALGSNVTYGVWLNQAKRQPENLPFTIATIRVVDSALANRAYGLLFVTGLIMVYLARLSLSTPWLLAALGLYVIVALLGSVVFAPNLRKQVSLLQSEGVESPAFQALRRRSNQLGMLVILITVVIVFLMVVKPGG